MRLALQGPSSSATSPGTLSLCKTAGRNAILQRGEGVSESNEPKRPLVLERAVACSTVVVITQPAQACSGNSFRSVNVNG